MELIIMQIPALINTKAIVPTRNQFSWFNFLITDSPKIQRPVLNISIPEMEMK